MVDNEQTTDEESPAAPAAPRRGPGHRGADMRDTVAEMAERAQLISQEAGSKVSSAMKDVISAAAGLAGFAVESARDLVQYMVRRGQMTQDEADKLIREAEEAHGKRSPGFVPPKAVAPVERPSVPRVAPKPADTPAATVIPIKAAAAASPPAAKAAAPKTASPVKAAPVAPKKAAAAAKKPATTASKGAVKRPAVAKASAKPAKASSKPAKKK